MSKPYLVAALRRQRAAATTPQAPQRQLQDAVASRVVHDEWRVCGRIAYTLREGDALTFETTLSGFAREVRDDESERMTGQFWIADRGRSFLFLQGVNSPFFPPPISWMSAILFTRKTRKAT